MSEWQWTAGPDETGLRLDKFLAAANRLGSRARATAALARGKIFLNGVEAATGAAATRVGLGDSIRVWMDRPGSARRARPG